MKNINKKYSIKSIDEENPNFAYPLGEIFAKNFEDAKRQAIKRYGKLQAHGEMLKIKEL